MKTLLQLSYTIALVEEQGKQIQAPLVLDQQFSWEGLEAACSCPCLRFKWALEGTFGWGMAEGGCIVEVTEWWLLLHRKVHI